MRSIQIKRDTAANWTTNDPTLAIGQPGYETDTRKLKIGDGTNSWTSLGYVEADGGGSSYTFENGLTESGGVAVLGGTLTADTIIDGSAGYEFKVLDALEIELTSSNDINLTSNGSTGIVLDSVNEVQLTAGGGNGITLTSANQMSFIANNNASPGEFYMNFNNGQSFNLVSQEGEFNINNGGQITLFTKSSDVKKYGITLDYYGALVYDDDYSADFVDRTLVDKAFVVQSIYEAGTSGNGSSYTFENGLTEASGVVSWGGTLTDDTSILLSDKSISLTTMTNGGSTALDIFISDGSTTNTSISANNDTINLVAQSHDSLDYASLNLTHSSGTATAILGSSNNVEINANGDFEAYAENSISLSTNTGPITLESNDLSISTFGGALSVLQSSNDGITIENDGAGLMNIVSGGGIVFENISGGDTNIKNTSDAGALWLTAKDTADTLEFSIILNAYNGIVRDATTNQHGLKYESDYSATYDDRSLVDKAYVDSVVGGGGGTTYTFANGLHESAGTAGLGGTLNANTTIDLSTYDLKFSSDSVQYTADYSSTYTSRSLVDKAYVDSVITATGSTTVLTSLSSNTTLDATYAGKTIECTGTFTVTLPNSMSTGMTVNIVNISTGVITLAASTTLNTKGTYKKLASQYGAAQVYHQGSNVWIGFGDLTA